MDLHGDIGLVKFANETFDAKQLTNKLSSLNIIFDDFDEAHLIVCFSATKRSDTPLSLAQSFANITGLKTTGYNGRVYPTNQINSPKTVKAGADVELTNYSVATENPFKRSNKEYKNFNYSPVIFNPQKKVSASQQIRGNRNLR